jgi:nucleoside-diphosphate-sugar epimerase
MDTPGITLVTGANGFIGSHLVDLLLARGARVRALVRPTSDLTFLDPRAEIAHGDLSRPFGLERALRGVTAVYHVAGLTTSFRRRDYREVNETGTRLLLRVCRKVAPGIRRFLLVSSQAAAGPSRDGRPVREANRPRPVSDYGRTKLLGERAAFEEAGEIPVTVVRPPIVYGPRDREMLLVFRLAGSGSLPSFLRDKFHSVIHVEDLVRGMVLAAERPCAKGRVYHLADPRAYALSHLLDLIAEAVGGPVRRIPVPPAILPILGSISDTIVPLLGLPLRPLRDKARELGRDIWVADVGRAERDLGFAPRRRLAEGIRETARFYLEHGWIDGCGRPV